MGEAQAKYDNIDASSRNWIGFRYSCDSSTSSYPASLGLANNESIHLLDTVDCLMMRVKLFMESRQASREITPGGLRMSTLRFQLEKMSDQLYGFDLEDCLICGGAFIPKDTFVRVYFDDEPDGFACNGCANESAENIRTLLGHHSVMVESQAFELDVAYSALNIALDDPEVAKEKLSDYLPKLKEEAKGLGVEASILVDYCQFTSFIRTASPNPNGFVYLLGCPEGYCKIGRTKNLQSRLSSIGLQLPWRIELLHSIPVSDPVWAERFLHQKFTSCRMNGEWFLLSDSDIQWIKSLDSLEL